ncbi:hypothetical protein ACEN2J_13750 [Pseudorhodobacter sp. W20_MBD10_FR17]|uniref:hypothetical protein n=1 Tax=Pseudorhodobacter sp. W20_MBD10_FR17 TaxID=3240266 RepID=UPI003F9A51CE
MQVFRQDEADVAAVVSWGVRVLLLAAEDSVEGGAVHNQIATRIAGLGGMIETEKDAFAALETLTMDGTGFGLFVINSDHVGGLEASRKLVCLMHKGGVDMPVILVSTECATSEFPNDSHAPVVLRAPLSVVAMRVGFEHAMRNRLVFRAA